MTPVFFSPRLIHGPDGSPAAVLSVEAATFTSMSPHTDATSVVPLLESRSKEEATVDIGATITSKGQITLPKAIRDALDLRTGDRVLFRLHADRVVLAKVPDFLELAGSMPPPPGKRGLAWSRIRAEAWSRSVGGRARGRSRKNP
jgi:antitoxin PrlF